MSRSLKISPFDRVHMTSYRHSIATMGLSRTISEINGDFGWKSQIFPTHPHVLCIPAEGVPLGIEYRCRGQKIRMTGLLGRERSMTIPSAIWIQSTNVTDGQTDGRTDTGRKQRLYLCIASRDKNLVWEGHCHGKQTIIHSVQLNFKLLTLCQYASQHWRTCLLPVQATNLTDFSTRKENMHLATFVNFSLCQQVSNTLSYHASYHSTDDYCPSAPDT